MESRDAVLPDPSLSGLSRWNFHSAHDQQSYQCYAVHSTFAFAMQFVASKEQSQIHCKPLIVE